MMYTMSTKKGTVITRKESKNLKEAIDLFSRLKNLPRNKLLDIFIVEQAN